MLYLFKTFVSLLYGHTPCILEVSVGISFVFTRNFVYGDVTLFKITQAYVNFMYQAHPST